MSIFPTKILLAIDGSESATHATQAAVELSKKTDSELHVLHVGEDPYLVAFYPSGATNPEGVERVDPTLKEELGSSSSRWLVRRSTRRLRRCER